MSCRNGNRRHESMTGSVVVGAAFAKFYTQSKILAIRKKRQEKAHTRKVARVTLTTFSLTAFLASSIRSGINLENFLERK